MSPNELSELAPIAATLNQESNEVNKLIASLNEELAALNLGIEVWLESPAEADPDCTIGFSSIGEGEIQRLVDQDHEWYEYPSSKWQLAVRRKMSNGLNDTIIQPLLKASRNVRIEALQQIPRIIYLLRREAETKISAIQGAKQLVSELSEKRKS